LYKINHCVLWWQVWWFGGRKYLVSVVWWVKQSACAHQTPQNQGGIYYGNSSPQPPPNLPNGHSFSVCNCCKSKIDTRTSNGTDQNGHCSGCSTFRKRTGKGLYCNHYG
jgi:hypothetical protein